MPRTIVTGIVSIADDSAGNAVKAVTNGNLDTTANLYSVGCEMQDEATGLVYRNTGTVAAPVWTLQSGQRKIISGQGATRTLSANESGALVLFDRAAGIVFTLPAPVIGASFTFLVLTSITSNAMKVITDAGTTFLVGSLLNTKASDGTTLAVFADGTTILSVSGNGTTTGGLKGTRFTVTCVDATHWLVEGFNLASGTIATPFATS